MNIQDAVSTIMSTDLKTLSPEDKLQDAKDLFGTYSIHHIPVVEDEKVVGILSKLDLMYFLNPIHPESNEKYLNRLRLKNYTVGEAMSKGVVSVKSTDSIQAVLEIFSENLFHAVPVEEEGRLVGIITTHDIIFRLLHPQKQIAS